MDNDQKNRLLRRGVTEIIVESEFVELLEEGKPLRLKMGFDPSAPDLHLGHAVGLRKLRQLQDLGHKVVVIVGDWTAQIGDPSGQSATRPMLTAEEVLENAETYMAQFFKVVEREKTEMRLQSDWFGAFTLTDVIRLTSRFTVAQFLAREDFSRRFKANQPIAITELLYPLMQGYDSVAVESDVEFGGIDQKFNLLVGRDLQRMTGQRPQQCFLMPLLVGTDGVRKMSKSLNNYIGLDEPPNEMYGKVMSLPDLSSAVEGTEMASPGVAAGGEEGRRYTVINYFDYLTDVPERDLEEMHHALDSGTVNPMDLKKQLARDLVTQFHDAQAARDAEGYFERTVQRRKVPEDVQVYALPPALEGKRISDIILDAGLAKGSTDARRLINQGAVRVNEQAISTNAQAGTLKSGDIVRVGRRRMVRIA